LPYIRLVQKANMLTYGKLRSGYVLVGLMTMTWLLAATKAFRRKGEENTDRFVLLAAALIPIVWACVLPQHTSSHATFMVRILVVPLSLSPLAFFWRWTQREPA
jgi:hypothetical protein